ncbi:rhomboid family intramembrane serine protease [Candidatus Nanopelagicales bacterium]|nr:rhomboid family intramembrane serine protease [Candidatus Nanopelagicales bacterium]
MESQASPKRRTALQTLQPVLLLLAAMWIVEAIDFVMRGQLDFLGIQARTLEGLSGVVLAPFLHGDFSHLISNTVPFAVLGSLVAWRTTTKGFWWVTGTITVIGGLGVWLLAPAAVITIGASGLIFGYLTFLITNGIITRHWLDIVVALAVLLIYGTLLLGTLPFGVAEGVSWLAHLTGAVAGVLAGLLFASKPDQTPV